jgi:hypothetical protein
VSTAFVARASLPHTSGVIQPRFSNSGGHSKTSPEKLAELLFRIGEAIRRCGGNVTTGYAAVVVTATRIDPAISANRTSSSRLTQTRSIADRFEAPNGGSMRPYPTIPSVMDLGFWHG